MADFKLQERDAKITKKLWESMLLINNNFDTKNPIVMAAIDKIAGAVRELESWEEAKE